VAECAGRPSTLICILIQMNFVRKNENAPRVETLRRILQYLRRWNQLALCRLMYVIASETLRRPVRALGFCAFASPPQTPTWSGRSE
jgi:hypothetical protein